MKKFLSILLIIVVVVILSVNGFKYFENQKELELKKQKQLEREQYEKKMIGLLEKNIVIQVYMQNEITENEMIEIENKIREIKHINNIEFISKETALDMMRELLGDNEEILDGYYGENNIFPNSYKIYCEIDSIDNLYYEDIIKKLESIEGIDEVRCNYKSIIEYYENGTLEEFLEKSEEVTLN